MPIVPGPDLLTGQGNNGTSWIPKDLGPALKGEGVTPPTVCRMDDGEYLFYAGRSNGMHGEPEGGKSWVAIIAMAQELLAGRNACFIDYEDNEVGIVERLRALGVPDPLIDSDQFDYIHPEEPLGAESQALEDLCQILAAKTYSIIVVDSTGEAMGMEGLDPIVNHDSNVFVNRLVRRCVATGACVILIDHVAKGRETRGDWAIGAQHKRAMIRGASYVVANKRPFGRGIDGELWLTVAKDTPGHVRGRIPHGQPAARLCLSFDADTGHGSYHLDTLNTPGSDLLKRLEAYLRENPGAGKGRLRQLGNSDTVDKLVVQLIEEEVIQVRRVGKMHAHFWVDGP